MNKIIELNETLINNAKQELKAIPFSKTTIKLKTIAALNNNSITKVAEVFGIRRNTIKSWIITIIFKEISNQKNQSLLKNRIRNFIYYDKVMSSFKELPCEVLKEYLDVGNEYYDGMALEYLSRLRIVYTKEDFIGLINKCISSKKILTMKLKLNQQN